MSATAEPRTLYFFDTEFMESGRTAPIELLSIGIVCDDGRELYRVSGDADVANANEWVRDNVLPHLFSYVDPQTSSPQIVQGVPLGTIAQDIREFVRAGSYPPEFWAYYAAYDWVVLCQLFGRMVDLPVGWPMFCMDVKQLAVSFNHPELPQQMTTEHNALDDARWAMAAWEYVLSSRRYPSQFLNYSWWSVPRDLLG